MRKDIEVVARTVYHGLGGRGTRADRQAGDQRVSGDSGGLAEYMCYMMYELSRVECILGLATWLNLAHITDIYVPWVRCDDSVTGVKSL